MTDQLPLQGPQKGECGCGCGVYGTLKHPNRAGVRCVRGCTCPSCRGKRNRASGGRKQSKAARALGIPRTSGMHPGNEETFGGTIRVEIKSGAQVGPIDTRFRAAEAQSEAQRPFGDHRPFCMVAMPKGTQDGIVLIRLSAVHEWAAALVEQWGAA